MANGRPSKHRRSSKRKSSALTEAQAVTTPSPITSVQIYAVLRERRGRLYTAVIWRSILEHAWAEKLIV